MKNWVTITRNFLRNDRDLREITEWARTHCPTYITNDYGIEGGRESAYDSGESDPNTVDYFFGVGEQGQRDMVIFTLRWA